MKISRAKVNFLDATREKDDEIHRFPLGVIFFRVLPREILLKLK